MKPPKSMLVYVLQGKTAMHAVFCLLFASGNNRLRKNLALIMTKYESTKNNVFGYNTNARLYVLYICIKRGLFEFFLLFFCRLKKMTIMLKIDALSSDEKQNRQRDYKPLLRSFIPTAFSHVSCAPAEQSSSPLFHVTASETVTATAHCNR